MSLEKKIFKFVDVFSLFRYYLPLEKGGSFFEQTGIPFSQWCFVPSLFEIGLMVLEKKMKMGKVYRQTDGQRTTGNQKGSHELSVQES